MISQVMTRLCRHSVLVALLFVSIWVVVVAEALDRQLETSVANTASIQQYFDGVTLSSYLAQQSINDNVLISALIACIPDLLSSSISSITASTSTTAPSIEVVTTLVSDALSASSATSFSEAIISGQYNINLQTFASQYGSTSLLNASCQVAVVSYDSNQSSSSSASSNVGIAVGLTIFSIFMGSICCCVGIWYYRKLRAEILEEKREGQHFNLTTLGQSNSSSNPKHDGYTRTLSRHSTLQNMEEAEDPQSSSVIVEDDKKMIWTTPFHDT